MRKGRLLYAGKYLKRDNSVGHIYYELNKNNSTGKIWQFKTALFKKGTIGSIYDCEFVDNSVSFNKNTIPTSFIKDENGHFKDSFLMFPILHKAEEQTRQIEIKIRNSKKPETLLDIEIKTIKEIYKSLSPQARASFIGNIVFKITS